MTELSAFFTDVMSNVPISELLELYGTAFVYIGTVFLGEIVILSSFILSGQGALDFSTVFVFGVLGTLTADLFWYITGSLFFSKPRFIRYQIPKAFLGATQFFEKVSKNHAFLLFLFSKFIFGARLSLILYFTWKRLVFTRFIVFDILGVLLFVITLSIFGWFSGKGVSHVASDLHIISTTAFLLIVLLVVLRLIKKWVTRNIVKNTSSS